MTRSEHRRYGVSVLVRPVSVRAVRAVGQDGLAIRTGQLRSDPSKAHSIAVSLSLDREALVVALRGSAPLGASRDGPPSPRRLEQPSPCTSSISDAPRRRHGHPHRLHGPVRGWLHLHLAVRASLDPRDLDRFPRRTLRSCVSHDRDAFRRVAIDRVAPIAQVSSAFLFECAAPPGAPFSPRSRRCVRQHVVAEYPSASAVSPIRLAAGRASRRAMRRTDFCLLTSSYEHPRLAGSRCVNRFRACAVGEIACFTAVRFASVGRTFSLGSPRRACCSRRDACVPDL
jgi:hypothetical protein